MKARRDGRNERSERRGRVRGESEREARNERETRAGERREWVSGWVDECRSASPLGVDEVDSLPPAPNRVGVPAYWESKTEVDRARDSYRRVPLRKKKALMGATLNDRSKQIKQNKLFISDFQKC